MIHQVPVLLVIYELILNLIRLWGSLLVRMDLNGGLRLSDNVLVRFDGLLRGTTTYFDGLDLGLLWGDFRRDLTLVDDDNVLDGFRLLLESISVLNCMNLLLRMNDAEAINSHLSGGDLLGWLGHLLDLVHCILRLSLLRLGLNHAGSILSLVQFLSDLDRRRSLLRLICAI